MENTVNPSVGTRIASFLFFLVLTVASFWWFIASIYGTLNALHDGAEVVAFSKGAMYALGAGIILLLFVILGVYQNLKKVDFSGRQTKWATKAFILAVVAMFVFPMIAHLSVGSLAEKRGYSECEEMSYRWLLYKKVVYVSGQDVCHGSGR